MHIWNKWKIFAKRGDKRLPLWSSFVLFSVCAWVGGVFVTCRGPGTTGCRPQQLQNGLRNTPDKPTAVAATPEMDQSRVYPEKACLLSVALN